MRPSFRSLAGPVALTSLLLACDREPGQAESEAAQAPQPPDPGPRPDAPAPDAPSPDAPPPSPDAPAEPPAYVVVPWGARLHAEPSHSALKLTLPKPNAQARELLGEGVLLAGVGPGDPAGRWWKLETLRAPSGTTPAPLDGLDVYALTVYVPAGLGVASATTPGEAPDPGQAKTRLQHGGPESAGSRWEIDAGAMVFWPDGKLAGEVVYPHAFDVPGDERRLDGVVATCFSVSWGPARLREQSELCYERVSVEMRERAAVEPDAG